MLDSSRVAASGDSEITANAAQYTLSSSNRYLNYRTFDLLFNTYLTLGFSPFHSVPSRHGRQELSTRLEDMEHAVLRDPRQRETSGDRITRGEAKRDA